MTKSVPIHAPKNTPADAVLASLPLSFSRATHPAGAVVVLDGSKDWPQAAEAILDSSVAVLVVHPEPADTSVLRGHRGASLVIQGRWAANPAVQNAVAVFSDALSLGGRLECRTELRVGAPLESALLDQLMLVRTLIGEVADVRLLIRNEHGYAAEALAAGHAVDLSVVCTNAVQPNAAVRVLTGEGSVELTIPSADSAQPAHLAITGPDGTRFAPTIYESGHRASWRRVHRLVRDRLTTTDLYTFEADMRLVTDAFSRADSQPSSEEHWRQTVVTQAATEEGTS